MKAKLINALIQTEIAIVGDLTDEQIAQRKAFYETHDEAELAMELAA